MPVRDFPVASRSAQERFEAWAAAPDSVPDPRPAATVLLVRDGVSGVEVFLQRRVATMAFAPRMHVFPGGSVDALDAVLPPWAGPTPDEWAALLGVPAPEAGALVVAAVRELFEEAGVLLAGAADGGPSALSPAARAALLAREISLGMLLRDNGFVVRSDLLGYHAHWVTPRGEPRRYDTHFFTALLPDGQRADAETTEADVAVWRRPAEVLADPTALLLPPTAVCLEQLALAPSAAALVARRPTARIEPVPVRTANGWVLRTELETP